ncbi:MAG: DUF3841 domain-containing protein [Lachnospiraceae bacterium]|nr:DUF3841 domain-containing protein [Lachnospiraceae bacterium]
MGEKVRIYTRQNDKTLEQFNRDGRVINDRRYVEKHFGDIAPLFMESYDWFTREACKMVPKPEDVHAPIWGSISVKNCLKPVDNTVIYILEIDKDKVVYFDEEKWDYVLNRLYLPLDKEDEKKYLEDLARKGFKNRFLYADDNLKNKFPLEIRKIRDSWQRVFQIDNFSILNVCGNIWEINKEDVVKIVYPGEDILKIVEGMDNSGFELI